jgi:hypothetical protein
VPVADPVVVIRAAGGAELTMRASALDAEHQPDPPPGDGA